MTASVPIDSEPRWDPALVRRVANLRSLSAMSLGVAAFLLPMLGPDRLKLAVVLLTAIPAATITLSRVLPTEKVLAYSSVVDTFWAVIIALVMPSVFAPAMLVTVSLLAFVANEDTRALIVGSVVGTIGFVCAGALHRVDQWQVLVIVFILMLPVLFFVSVTQHERDVRHKMRIRHKVEHDSLTGLLNRTGLTAAMDTAPVVAVIAIDLDGFKDINDTLGHDAGDELLIALASRMAGIVGRDNVLARTGGDEFAVLVRGRDTRRLAGELLRACRHRIALGDLDVSVGASIGVAVAEPGDGANPLELMRRADLAMYEAKRTQRGVTRWSDQTRSASKQRVSLSGDVERGFEMGEFELFFQPIVDVWTDRCVDVEGLLRWRHPHMGLLTPGDFLELVESIGHRSTMDSVVFDQAAALAAQLQAFDIGVSVNVSAGSLMRSSVPQVLAAALSRHDVVPQRVTVEVIEDEMVDEQSTARAVLSALGDLGVGIAIDDFGTGHSSLSRLRRLPVTSLKIDRSFVLAMLDNDDDEAIVTAVSHLGRALDLVVVAEGVEDLAVRDRIIHQDLPIDRIQGYGIARPMPAPDLLNWIEARQPIDLVL